MVYPTSPLHRLQFIAYLAAIALSATGCGSEGGRTGSAGNQQPDDGPVIALTEDANAWPAAIVRGRLTEQDGCLLIGDSVAIFPSGTSWDAPVVTFPDGQTVEVNSHVRMGGGGFDIAALTQKGSPIVPVSEVRECAELTGSQEYVWAAPEQG